MEMKLKKKSLPFLLRCVVLIAAIALYATGCGKTESGQSAGSDGIVAENGQVLGEGASVFAFTVVDKEGSEVQLEIHTDKETVGAALMELGLISGDESEYGLYVKTVNGITADYDKDGVYWAFYVNGEYAMTGVDSTPITEGESYAFKVE